MSEPKPDKRLTDLDVDEVSLVDLPANERPFLVLKQKGASAMSGTNEEAAVAPAKPAEKQDGGAHAALVKEKVEAVQKLAGSISADMTAKDLRDVIWQMQDIAYSISGPAEVVQALAKSLAVVAKADPKDYENYGEAENKDATAALAESINALLTAAKSVLEKIGKADPEPKPPDGEEEEAMPADDKDKTQKTVEAILKAVKELPPETQATITKGLVPEPEKPAEAPVVPAATPEKPTESPDIAALRKSVADLTVEVTELRKGREAPASAPADGTATSVQKSTSIWEGAL